MKKVMLMCAVSLVALLLAPMGLMADECGMAPNYLPCDPDYYGWDFGGGEAGSCEWCVRHLNAPPDVDCYYLTSLFSWPTGALIHGGQGCVAHNLGWALINGQWVQEQGPTGCTYAQPSSCWGYEHTGLREGPMAWDFAANTVRQFLLDSSMPHDQVASLENRAADMASGKNHADTARIRYGVFYDKAVQFTGWKNVPFGSLFSAGSRVEKAPRTIVARK